MVLPSPVYSSAPYVLNRLNRLARYSARTRKLIKFARTAGNFLIGNPFTPAGRLSWGIAAAKAGILYGGHKAYKYIMSKRQRISSSGMGTQAYGTTVDAGATNVVQRSWHTSRGGKRPKKNARLALRMLNASQSFSVLRYQRMSAYEGAYDAACDVASSAVESVPLPLGHLGYSAQDYIQMPVQLFDLTSISSAPEGSVTLDGLCNFSLFYHNAPAVGNFTEGQYGWRINNSLNYGAATGATLRHWFTEQAPNGTAPDTRPQITKRCFTPWVDIRMVLYGATTETTRFTVQLVQIKEDMFDPYFMQFEPTAAKPVQAQQRFNQYWNGVLKPKVFNPIASSGVKPESIFKVLSHKTYVIGPDSSTNFDTFQPNVVCKKFYNLNRVCNYDWLKGYTPSGVSNLAITGNQESALGPPTEVKINTDAELDSTRFNQYLRNDTLPFLHPKAKVYLLVMADCYSKQTCTNLTTPPENGATKVPCMDIIIRKKVIYDDT